MKTMIRCLSLAALLVLSSLPCMGVEVDKRHPSGRKEKPSAKEIAEERDWIAVDKTSSAALEAYLAAKPRGSRIKQAEMLLAVTKRFDAILAGMVKPVVVIPFDGGEPNPLHGNKKTGVAISYDKTHRVRDEVGICWTYEGLDYENRSSETKGVYADLTFAAWPGRYHGRPGSILALDSAGEVCPSKKVPVIVSDRKNVVYFGVMENVGFVHIQGEGRVVFPDGRITPFR